MSIREQFKAARRYLRGTPSLWNLPPRVDRRLMTLAERTLEGRRIRQTRGYSSLQLGCQCAECKETNRYASAGFEAWPRDGDTAGRRAVTGYNAHVRACYSGGANGLKVGAVGAAFYGVPAGSTRARQAEVLRASFANPPPEEEEDL